MKRKLLYLMSLFLFISTQMWSQDSSGTTGDLTWTLTNGTLTISGKGNMGSYGAEPKFRPPWLANEDEIHTVIVENGVKSIGEYAFHSLENITSVSLPETLTTIEDSGFGFCKKLTSIQLPASLTSIGAYVFRQCENLESIILPDGITTIGNMTFYDCKKLKSVTLPANLTFISQYAFANCTALESITLPASVATLEMYAFQNTTSLTTITSLMNTPIDLRDDIFTGIDANTRKLIVPTNAVTAYQSAPNWKDFTIQGGGYLVSAVPNNSAYGSVKGANLYADNATVELTANAATGCVFENWTVDGDEVSTDNPYSFPAEKDIAIVANFKKTGSAPQPEGYYVVDLEVGAGIDLYNLNPGKLEMEQGSHLHLQFLAEDSQATADDILFLVDSKETSFKYYGGNYYCSYILNNIQANHSIVIALREYPVTLPELDGGTLIPVQPKGNGPGTYNVAYGQSFRFALSAVNAVGAKVYANGIELKADNDILRSDILSPDEPVINQEPDIDPIGKDEEDPIGLVGLYYTIEKVTGPVIITIEGLNPASNNPVLNLDFQLFSIPGQLMVETFLPLKVQVYNISGILQAGKFVNGRETFTLSKGIYFVKVGSITRKMVIE